MSGRDWLQCHCCGADAIESDENGLFWDGDSGTCPECGVVSWVSCDSETPADLCTDEMAEDIGQPHCDNSCGGVYLGSDSSRAYIGTPCKWDCAKVLTWRTTPGILHQGPRDLSRVAVRTCPISGLESHR